MPRVIIRKEDLPPVSMDGSYIIRMRIVSDDKNSSSYWTPIHNIVIPQEGDKLVKNAVMASIYANRIGSGIPANYNIYISWHDPNNLGFYDVYTRWFDGTTWTDWLYMSTQTTRNLAINPPLYLSPTIGFTKYMVSVTRANYHHVYNPDLSLFSTPPDGISLV